MAEQPKRRVKSPRQSIAEHSPWMPQPYTVADAYSIKALATGQASEEQQRRAIKWIIEVCAMTYDQPYRPGEDGRRDTDFACGRQAVGKEIVKLINMPGQNLRRDE